MRHLTAGWQNWKSRYVVLADGWLEYYRVKPATKYRSTAKYKLKGRINIARTNVSALADSEYRKPNCFCVNSNVRREFLVASAPLPEHQAVWVRSISSMSIAALRKDGDLEKRMQGLRKVNLPT